MADPAFTTVQLRDEESGLQATFVPTAGMLCCSLRHHGEELLAQNAGVTAYAERGKTMGIPLLYPWANRLADFDYSVAGRTVVVPHDPTRIALDDNGLPIHGVIGGRQRWELTHTSDPDAADAGTRGARSADPGGRADDADAADAGASGAADPGGRADDPDAPVGAPDAQSLAARLSWSESHQPELFEVFPFRHDLHYEVRLADGRLDVTITVHACGEDAVPVAFGLHPYLSPPGVPRECYLVELPPMRRLALDADQIPVAPEHESPSRRFELAGSEFDDGFDAVSQPARFSVEAGERRIALEFLEGYPCAQVFAPKGGQFICFEPMTAPANALRSATGLRLLAPGERYRAAFAVRIQNLTPRK